MRLTEIKGWIEHLPLTRSLGQNFMHDQNQLRRMVTAAGLGPRDPVLEIGPGLGPLTELLIGTANRVLAIEKDARLIEILQRRLPSVPRLELLHADALEFLRTQPRNWADWKMVSNLPYSCASPILVELAQANQAPSLIVATVQLEVAQRLAAGPGGSEYGLLSLLIQNTYRPAESFRIPASCFYPQPGVDSACVTLCRRPAPLVPRRSLATYVALVKRAFSQRRKMVGKLLRQDWPDALLEPALQRAEISPKQRAAEISPAQFARLTEALTGQS